jgi:hypothetical protein
MRFKTLAFFAAIVAASPLSAVALSRAQATPQILGLIASATPIPMTCAGGTCTAELSSVCLQQHRPTPPTGTVYRPANNTQITLTVRGSNGVARRMPVAAMLDYVSLRQFSAVKVSLPEAAVRRLGSGVARISVAPMASIIPVAVAGDPRPLSAGEIARYTGPLRELAERAFERDSARINATRILNRMVNRLPERSNFGIEKMAPLWRQTVAKDVSAKTRKFLAHAVKECRETLRTGVMADLRECLSYHHDYLSGENTNNGWRAMNPGS